MLTRPYVGPAVLFAGVALLAFSLKGAVFPVSAQAPGPAACGTTSVQPCELTGFKVVADPNDPTLYVLQVESKQGLRSFVGNRAVLERHARELLDALEGRGAKNL